MSETAVSTERARAAWRDLMSLAGWGGGRPPRVPAVAIEFDLSPKQLVLLWRLEPGTTLSMGSIGQNLHCDASFATSLVDKLEADGMIERRSDPGDRRVTLVALTTAGKELRERILERLYEPPEEFSSLTDDELDQLALLLAKAAASD